MYRDSMAELRARGLARLRAAIDEAEPVFKRSVGNRASARLMKALAGAKAAVRDFTNATRYELDQLDTHLDEVEASLAACVAEEARRAEHFSRYQRLGIPSHGADIVHDATTVVSVLEWGLGVNDALLPLLHRWTPQLPHDVVMEVRERGMEISFERGGHPFRLELEAKPFRDDPPQFYAETELVAPVRTQAHIEIRPQTFGDDVLLAVRLRREVVFGDDAFDPLYFVNGHDSETRELLTPETRAAFVSVAKEDPAHVSLEGGIATMRLGLQRLASACALLAMLD